MSILFAQEKLPIKHEFLLTKELGRLAKWLRILGFDTAYFNQDNTSSLIIQALRDNCTIITRNRRLPKSSGIKIVLLKAEKIKEQVSEVLKALKIEPNSDMMFTRCIICNEELIAMDKEKIKDKIPDYVFKTQSEFVTCPMCKRIYWQGTHWGNVQNTLKDIIK